MLPLTAFFARHPLCTLPGLMLMTLLQRAPAVRPVVAAAETLVLKSSLGQLLRGVFTLSGLGAMHSRAGATTFIRNPAANPLPANVGVPISMTFTYTGTPSAPQYFRVTGSLPPGLRFTPALTNGSVISRNPVISGTPTVAGEYTIFVQGFGTGGNGPLEPIRFSINDGSSPVPQTVNSPPAILTQPAPQTLLVGQPLQLSVTASGAAPLSYQWLRSGTVLAGATTATYSVANATLTDAGTYSVLVTNSLGSTYSATAEVTVAQPAAPAITVQPQPLSVVTGGTATFSVEVTAAPAPTFQWLRNGTPLGGATNRILTLTNLSAANAGTYAVTVSNTLGTTLSSPAALTVTLPVTAPTFTSQPRSQSATAGATVVLTAGVSANPAPTFQWLRNGVQLPGATNSSLLIPAASPSDAGTYAVIAANAAGTVTSANATLTVTPGSALSNLSVRTTLPAGQTLIVGAVVSGGPKSILLRAAGPALNKFGLVGMVDPRLELYTGTTLAGSNDTWASSLTTTFSRVGAFAFDPGSLDAALSQSISGAFTVQTRGTGPGTVLVEAYDAAGGVTPRLVNLSARNQVGSGADILIAGFALSGSGTKQVLIRAIGPTLAVFGVGGALADPRLTLLSGAGATLAENDNWDTPIGSAAAVASAIFTQVGAFPLPAGSRDAALLITLNAGASYTVQVAGVNNTTGEALIEVYEVF